MGETLAKSVPGAVALGRNGGGLEKRGEVEFGCKRDVDVDSRKPRRFGSNIGSGCPNRPDSRRRGHALERGLWGLHRRFRGPFERLLRHSRGLRPAGEHSHGLAALRR